MYKKLKSKIRRMLDRTNTLYKISKNKAKDDQIAQIALMNQYRMMQATLPPEKMPAISDTGFKVYSQFDEDGILAYIFALIGFTNRKVVEICAGSGEECNTANLIINHGCHGLLFDGDQKNIEQARFFFSKHPNTFLFPPICKHAWITTDNINELIREEGFAGEIDLVSLDIDGNDYWIWKAIEVISPRVFICEVHNICPDDLAITVPYKEDFCYTSAQNLHPDFRSVSPLAMISLCKDKGYRLVGAHKYGFNLVFLRDGVGSAQFPEVPLSAISNNPFTIEAKRTRWPQVKDAPWVKVRPSQGK